MSSKPVVKAEDLLGMHLFTLEKMRDYLPPQAYEQLKTAGEEGGKLDEGLADAVANAMRCWALNMGATHYTHWFQPRTEATAEKHMAFLSLDGDDHPIHAFSGKDLISSEPDASSFPNGGMRSTFEARGYCAWDPTSPAFIIPSRKGGTLCIPSVFIALDGTPLDMKTPLLRAIDAVSSRAMTLLKMFGNRSVKSVEVTVGAEQEFFLIEEEMASKRPDLALVGRALLGNPSPKEPAVEAHYLGAIAPRVIDFMEDVERDMYRLGTCLMARHNEASPCQFEFAPTVSEANRGCDANHLLMETMRRMARRHNLRLLLHEKPFSHMNGSGKHLNFSMRDSEGRNLLSPSSNPRRNLQFLTFLMAFVVGAQHHGGLLRASIASLGNMHRLGGHEAPPSVMTVYLGDVLSNLLDQLESGKNLGEIKGENSLDLGGRLPRVGAHTSDRNRTSPVAFTGNKFEFRGVGSPAAISGPLTFCLALWCDGLDYMINAIKKHSKGEALSEEAFLKALRDAARATKAVRFEGNGYDPSWPGQARKRGLPVCDTTLDALAQYTTDASKKLLDELAIMNGRELEAYSTIRLEQYARGLKAEMSVLLTMITEGVIPALTREIADQGRALSYLPGEAPTADWKEALIDLAKLRADLVQNYDALKDLLAKLDDDEDLAHRAKVLTEQGLPLMDQLRDLSNKTERRVARDLWPYPTLREVLTLTNNRLPWNQ